YLAVHDDALELSVRGRAHRLVDRFGRGLGPEVGREVGERDVGCGDPNGHAVELAVEMRQHQAHCLRGTGGGGDHRQCRGAAPTQVLAAGRVENRLVVGVAVDGGHQTLLHTKGVVEHLDHGGQTVGGAGRVGDDLVGLEVETLVVHTVHEGVV